MTERDAPGAPAPDEPATEAEPPIDAPADALWRDSEAAALVLDADGQPRLTLLGLSGRAVPALYLVGWIASVMGAGAVAISVMGASSAYARWVFVGGLAFLAIGLLAAAGSQAVERGRRPSLPFRGPSPVLAFAAVVVLTLLALLVVVAPLSALGLDPAGPLGTIVSLLVTTGVFLFIVRSLVVGTGALSWAEVGFGRSAADALANLGVGAALAVPVLVVTVLLTAVLAGLLAPPSSALPAATTPVALLLNLVSAAVLAPLGEEVFFRGYTTTAWARAYGARSAILRGALFFAFAHIATMFSSSFSTGAAAALTQFIALLPAGIALGWVFLARRSVWAAIGLHAAFNALQLILLYAATARG